MTKIDVIHKIEFLNKYLSSDKMHYEFQLGKNKFPINLSNYLSIVDSKTKLPILSLRANFNTSNSLIAEVINERLYLNKDGKIQLTISTPETNTYNKKNTIIDIRISEAVIKTYDNKR